MTLWCIYIYSFESSFLSPQGTSIVNTETNNNSESVSINDFKHLCVKGLSFILTPINFEKLVLIAEGI